MRSIAVMCGLFLCAAGAATPILAHETMLPTLTAGSTGEGAIIERRRETCWRTNRATKQRFRIC